MSGKKLPENFKKWAILQSLHGEDRRAGLIALHRDKLKKLEEEDKPEEKRDNK